MTSTVHSSLKRPLNRIFTLMLLQCLSVGLAVAEPQDSWMDTGISAGPPANESFAGPILAGDSHVFLGLNSGAIAVYDATNGAYQRMIGSFNEINGMALNSSGNLVVLNLSAPPHITVLDPADGSEVSTFGTAGSDPGQIRNQTTGDRQLLGIDENDNLYIGDPGDYQVKVFAADGTFIREWGEQGSLLGQFSGAIRALAVRQNGEVYLQAGRFYRFSADGKLLSNNSGSYFNLVLTPEGLPIASNRLFPYDLDGYRSFFKNAGDDGLSFSSDGTLWHWNYTTLSAYRRAYPGLDEPADSVARKAVPQPRIVKVEQRPDTTLLDIDFEIMDADSTEVEVRVIAWKEGSTDLSNVVVPKTWAEGTEANLGTGIATNTVHRITWDTAADFAEPYGTFEVEILARDDQPPIPVHWISIPATDGVPAFEISKRPMSDEELNRLLLWDAAGADPQIVQQGEPLNSAFSRLKGIVAYDSGLNAYLNDFGLSLASIEQRTGVISGRYGQASIGILSLYRGIQTTSFNPYTMVEVLGGTLPDIGNGALDVSTFSIGKFEVTELEWTTVRSWAAQNGYSDLPSSGSDLRPAASVNWYDVLKWCNALSEWEGLTPVYTVNGEVYRTGEVVPDQDLTADGYRLPTEAEWEFAARGGTLSEGYEYSGSDDVYAVAWYAAISSMGSKVVGTKQANELGLHDMSGNVWEWCWDPWSETSSSRVIRGGGWNYYGAYYWRVAHREEVGPTDRLGFRLSRSQSPPSLGELRRAGLNRSESAGGIALNGLESSGERFLNSSERRASRLDGMSE